MKNKEDELMTSGGDSRAICEGSIYFFCQCVRQSSLARPAQKSIVHQERRGHSFVETCVSDWVCQEKDRTRVAHSSAAGTHDYRITKYCTFTKSIKKVYFKSLNLRKFQPVTQFNLYWHGNGSAAGRLESGIRDEHKAFKIPVFFELFLDGVIQKTVMMTFF